MHPHCRMSSSQGYPILTRQLFLTRCLSIEVYADVCVLHSAKFTSLHMKEKRQRQSDTGQEVLRIKPSRFSNPNPGRYFWYALHYLRPLTKAQLFLEFFHGHVVKFPLRLKLPLELNSGLRTSQYFWHSIENQHHHQHQHQHQQQ